MAVRTQRRVNPKLADLRNSVDSPPVLDVSDLKEKMSRIPAAYLFNPQGKELLRMLCLCLCSTKNTLYYSGWKDFAVCLKIRQLVVEYIENCKFNNEDQAYNTLLAFVTQDPTNSTMDKVVDALQQTGRVDILNRTLDLMEAFAERVFESAADQDSGYFSADSGTSIESSPITRVIAPPYIPQAPSTLTERIRCTTISPSQTVIHEHYLRSSPIECPSPKVQNVTYGKTVLLTFATDGSKSAHQVASFLRKERDGFPRIGVVTLQEQKDVALQDPQLFIDCCLNQVDYVMPIITPKYLDTVMSTGPSMTNMFTQFDAHYARYIYTQINTHYMQQGCLNLKVRCVVPDEYINLANTHAVMKNSLFQAWVKESEVDMLTMSILGKKNINYMN